MNTETLGQRPPTTEQKFGREKLTHEKLRREFAKVALLAILISAYSRPDSDHLFSKPEQSKKHSPEAELLGLIFKALNPDRSTQQSRQNRHARSQATFDYGWNSYRPQEREYFNAFADHISTAKPKSDFVAAPTMAEKPLGPELPTLGFNDRIRAHGIRRPTDEDFKAADRANEMYRDSLFKRGWRGGEVTDEQRKGARADMMRGLHPDRNNGESADAGALTVLNSHFDHLKRESAKSIHEESPSSAPESAPSGFGHTETPQDSQAEASYDTESTEAPQETRETPLELTAAPEHPPVEHNNGESGGAGS